MNDMDLEVIEKFRQFGQCSKINFAQSIDVRDRALAGLSDFNLIK